MKKFENMRLMDQIQAIVLTKIQEYSLRFQYISNCEKISKILYLTFDLASKAHLKLFTGYDLDILLDRLPYVSSDAQLLLAKKIIFPFFKRNAAICMKEGARFTGEKFRHDLITVGGTVLFTKRMLNIDEEAAIEYLKVASGRLYNGHGKTAKPTV